MSFRKCGEALEWAWKGFLGGAVSGGYGDGGVDLVTAGNRPCQVKASRTGALEFLRVAETRGRWVADLLVGEPDEGTTRLEVFLALERDGIWASTRIPFRAEVVAEARRVRDTIVATEDSRRQAQRAAAGSGAPLRGRLRVA